MKKGSTIFLRLAVFVLGLGILAICIFALPAGIMNDNTGMYGPILLGLYIPAIPFFMALYQALKLLGYIDKNNAFSDLSVQALKQIKYCGISISILFTLGMPYIFTVADKDDAPGVVAIALVIVGASAVIATFAGLLQKLLKNAIDIKSENDLTV